MFLVIEAQAKAEIVTAAVASMEASCRIWKGGSDGAGKLPASNRLH